MLHEEKKPDEVEGEVTPETIENLSNNKGDD